MVAKHRERRRELKKAYLNPQAAWPQRAKAFALLQALPRDSSPVRLRRRCALTGRPRGNFRRFGVSRAMLRLMAMNGEIPGITKSSW